MSVQQQSFDFGDRITLTAKFVNASGQPADPTTVRWRLRPPQGAEIAITATGGAYELTSPAVGTHQLSFVPPAPGQWAGRCEGLGAVAQAAESHWLVRPSQFTTASTT